MAYHQSAARDEPPSDAIDIGVTEWLEDDDRPALILDMSDLSSLTRPRLYPVYTNPAFKEHIHLSNVLEIMPVEAGSISASSEQIECPPQFKSWATQPSLYDARSSSATFDSNFWTSRTLSKRWRVISGSRLPVGQSSGKEDLALDMPTTGSESSTPDALPGMPLRANRMKSTLWTGQLPWTEHAGLFRKTDWSKTALGPMESWSSSLRQMVLYLFADSRPGCLFWGSDKVIIYNESYIPLASTKHPESFASTCAITWSEIFSELDGVFRKAETSGYAATIENQLFLIEREGFLEENYFQGNIIPIISPDGNIEGFYNSVLEISKAVISDRRTKTLLTTTTSPSLASFWHEVLKCFESNSYDIPLAVIYSIEHQAEGNLTCKFRASLGVDDNHPTLVPHCDLHTSEEGLMPHFRKAIAARGPLLLTDETGTLVKHLFNSNHWRGFGVPSSRFVVLPLSAGEGVLGFMFWGLNPYRPHDEDSQQFVELLSRQLQSSLTSTVFLEKARLNQKKLESDLALAESRFKTLAELNPVGLFYISPLGEVLYGNDTCKSPLVTRYVNLLMCPVDYELTGHKRDHKAEM
ncbi:MAG: hypothetical protein Q9166_001487 [cf. Caloplaca sp. 2 TL-2023]